MKNKFSFVIVVISLFIVFNNLDLHAKDNNRYRSEVLKNYYNTDLLDYSDQTIIKKYGDNIVIEAGDQNQKVKIASFLNNPQLFDRLNVGDKVNIKAIKEFTYPICKGIGYETKGGVTISSEEPMVDNYSIPLTVFKDDGSKTIAAPNIMQFNRENVTIQELDYKTRKVLIKKLDLYKNSNYSNGKIYAHMKNGEEIFISDLSVKPNYSDNKLINAKNISHMDVQLAY